MLFQETWPLLQQGKKFTRGNCMSYIFMLPKMDKIWIIHYDLLDSNPIGYCPNMEDMLANDWEILE